MDEHTKLGTSEQSESRAFEAFPIVGIGASAGGLEALEQFFEHTPEQSGMCFVVVQHLSPDFKSLMDELLRRRTRIPIVRVEDGVEVHPNHIYLMPPRKEMVLSGGRLYLAEKDPNHGLALPIDHFLRSLAHDAGVRSVGVILSGTGSDGSRGIRDIHDAGGLVVAQCEESSRFDGMPRSARETGLVDLNLPACDMADAIIEFISRPHGRVVDSSKSGATPELGLQAILRMLRSQYGIDFSQYKPSTVTRRIDRRLMLNQSLNVEQYVQFLAENPAELNQLYKDLLIGVTEFFRDPDAFERLQSEILPKLMDSIREDREIRCWVTCCATGEEAYSLSILLHEYITSLGRTPNVKIFATDAHKSSLEMASAGLYTEEQIKCVSRVRRERYFTPKDDQFQIVPLLRKMIVFAPHDLLKDAPFTKLDLITCRNMLIYLQPGAQKKVLSLFHFGLNTGGFLFLGPSESPGDLSDELDTVDEHWKIYRKSRDVKLRPDFRSIVPPGTPPTPRLSTAFGASNAASDRLQQSLYDRLLETHMPPSFLINDRWELVHSFGGAGRYLSMRDGRVTSKLLELIDPNLKTVLLGAVPRAEKQLTAVSFTRIQITNNEGKQETIRLKVEPLHDRIAGLTSFLIVLETMEAPQSQPNDVVVDMRVASREQLESLEHDLRYTRENLQALIEEQESSNEELQATNEELVASNEELQSTNEELHSVNEELYTVNAEYQHKIDELTRLTADMENLLLVSDVGIIFLDTDLRIRRFTPHLARLFNFLPQDVGRFLGSFTNLLDVSLAELLQKVLRTEKPVEKEVRDRHGNCYFMRILPYRINPMTVDGIVLSLIDVSQIKKAESKLEYLSAIVESTGEAVVGKDLNGKILSWNRGAEVLYGYESDEIIGCSGRILFESDAEFTQTLALIRSDQTVTREQLRRRRDGSTIEVMHTISPIRDALGRIIGASGIAHDITERKQAEREIATAIRNRDRFLAMLSHELRNPLGAILNAVRVLERGDPKGQAFQEARRVVRRQAEQVGLLLDDLLDVARITQNKIDLRCKPCNIAVVVAESIEIIKPESEARKQQFEAIGVDKPVWVLGDPARLQQVVSNLLKNAIKYSPENARIGVLVDQKENHVVIAVQDSGVGIAAEILPKVFDLFVQSKETLDRSDGGMGVGLTLVKTIIELHGGTVSASSEGPGKGSEFRVRLPLYPHPLGETESAEEVSPKANLPSFRIAIIEDNLESASMLKSCLIMDGHSVDTAPNGIEGLELIQRAQPDVALIDIGLPGLDGFEIAKILRREHTSLRTFLIALTGYGLPADREKVISSGFNAHLVKPLSFPSLEKLLSQLTPG
jgi:two-component system CheB/CheR fusion protein